MLSHTVRPLGERLDLAVGKRKFPHFFLPNDVCSLGALCVGLNRVSVDNSSRINGLGVGMGRLEDHTPLLQHYVVLSYGSMSYGVFPLFILSFAILK